MAESPVYVTCSMCGLEFEKTETVCERSCMLNTSCNSVRCPGCDYEFPENSRGLSWMRRIFRRRSAPPTLPAGGETVTLDLMRSGERGELLQLTCMSDTRRNTLTVFGLTPGTELTLIQRTPSYVIRVGETELGLDREIAQGIYVRRTG
jgi:Fe2+ transport system protein FeoA